MFPVRAVLLERGQVYVSGVLTHSPSRRVFRRTFARSARPLVVEAEGVAQAPDVALDLLREELRLEEDHVLHHGRLDGVALALHGAVDERAALAVLPWLWAGFSSAATAFLREFLAWASSMDVISPSRRSCGSLSPQRRLLRRICSRWSNSPKKSTSPFELSSRRREASAAGGPLGIPIGTHERPSL